MLRENLPPMVARLRLLALCACVCGLLVLAAPRVWAQAELFLTVTRRFGYGGGSQIQGSFRMEATGPENLVSVTFYVDETAVGTVTEPPFRIDFRTDAYAPGWHALTAVGQTSDGHSLSSNARRFEFITSEQVWASMRGIFGPLIAVVVLAMLLSIAFPAVQAFRGKKQTLPLGAARRYGFLGGTICPKCKRPYALHLWSLNLGLSRLDRCDHCGQWSLVRRASREALTRAEAAELELAPSGPAAPGKSPEEKLKEQLDASRFVDRP